MANEKKKRPIFFDILDIPDAVVRAANLEEFIQLFMTPVVNAASQEPEDESDSESENDEDLGIVGRMMRHG